MAAKQPLFAFPHRSPQPLQSAHVLKYTAMSDQSLRQNELHLQDSFSSDLLHQPYAMLDHGRFGLRYSYGAHLPIRQMETDHLYLEFVDSVVLTQSTFQGLLNESFYLYKQPNPRHHHSCV